MKKFMKLPSRQLDFVDNCQMTVGSVFIHLVDDILMRRCQILKNSLHIQTGLAGLEKQPETKVKKEQV